MSLWLRPQTATRISRVSDVSLCNRNNVLTRLLSRRSVSAPATHVAMETAFVFGCSKVTPFGFAFSGNSRLSLRPFNKQLESRFLSIKNSQNLKKLTVAQADLKCSLSGTSNYGRQLYSRSLSSSTKERRTHHRRPIRCSYADTASSGRHNQLLKNLKNISLDSLRTTFSRLTPIDICKWSLAFSISIAAAKWIVGTAFNPFFWMYFSWTWMFWPWFVALGLAVYGLYCLRKHVRGESNVFEQLSIVTSAFTWLTLVPPAHFNGYLEGWPFVFFFVYHYFFFFNVSVRKRLYGDYYPRQHDPKWDVSPPNWCRLLFCAGVFVAHWLAAFEGPELHLIPGGWNNFWVWVLIMITLFAQYHSTLYLATYSEKVVVPTAVVQFGPYRWVRHPIYASTMLLFVTYFAALRAPFSVLFVVAVCLLYYEQKAKLEEALMIETFGTKYTEYMNRVRHKFIPFIY